MEPSFWNVEEDRKHFAALWNYRERSGPEKGESVWDAMATKWVKEEKHNTRRHNSIRRATETGKYLRGEGLLQAEDTVMDLGCGLGFFVTEFAKTCQHATGVDISSRMLERALLRTQEQGLSNTSFLQCDFTTADIRECGWERAFDLVFSSITPAIRGMEGLEKMMCMSRAFCFNSCFISRSDDLVKLIEREVYGKEIGPVMDWRSFYSLFNLLLLQGYFPLTHYYWEHRDDELLADRDTAADLAALIWHDQEQAQREEENIYRYVMEHATEEGMIIQSSDRGYAWTLWDIRRQRNAPAKGIFQ